MDTLMRLIDQLAGADPYGLFSLILLATVGAGLLHVVLQAVRVGTAIVFASLVVLVVGLGIVASRYV